MGFLNKRRRAMTKRDDTLIARILGKRIVNVACTEDVGTGESFLTLKLEDGNRLHVAKSDIASTCFTYYGASASGNHS